MDAAAPSLSKGEKRMASPSKPPYDFAHDEEAFKRSIPYELRPTNLKGVYTIPAPPEGFDPNTASRSERIRHGFLWRRPTANDPPELRAAWEKAFSRKWDRIVPISHPQLGHTTAHYRMPAPEKQEDGLSIQSSDWAGAVASVKNQTWNSIIGFWTVPTVNIPTEPEGAGGGWNSVSWIGIDGAQAIGQRGDASSDVLQAGIQQQIVSFFNGHTVIQIPLYTAFYEWNIQNPQPGTPGYVYITTIDNFPVSPGDEIYCSVQYVYSHVTGQKVAGRIDMGNSSSKTTQQFSITLAPPDGADFNGRSAEWIMEAPSFGRVPATLPAFTPVTFTTCVACSADETTIIHPGDDCDIWNVVKPYPGGAPRTNTTVDDESVTISYVPPPPP
jgi:hypothetical protein